MADLLLVVLLLTLHIIELLFQCGAVLLLWSHAANNEIAYRSANKKADDSDGE
jgi:hypothetical protein